MTLDDELNQYIKLRPKAKELWKRALKVLPGGISHTIRTFGLYRIGAFPLFIQSAKDAYMYDIDGNQYLDCWNGHFANILGHNHPELQEIIKNYLSNGWHFGTLTEYQVKLAEKLIEGNSGIEMVRFCSSGTEATMYATRLARAFTNKKLIAKAKLGWHGANDTLYYCVGNLDEHFVPPGLIQADEANIRLFEVNSEDIFDLIKNHHKDLAAVILEPVLGGGGGFPADLDFLKRLKEETERFDILLIFDEVITGYRFLCGLYQNELKVLPDLTTMGKIIGGGMPIGAIGGRKDILETSSPLAKNQVLIGGGTYSGFPLSMVAGLKAIEILEKSGNEYQRINNEGDRLRNQLNSFFCKHNIPMVAKGHKSLVMLHTLKRYLEEPSINEIIINTDKIREAWLHLGLLNRNISGLHGLGSLSMAHTKENVDYIGQKVMEIAPLITSNKND
ncbi:MAG: aspartate aminotransferase family protein [Candidatus Thorarchaeota archaeon]